MQSIVVNINLAPKQKKKQKNKKQWKKLNEKHPLLLLLYTPQIKIKITQRIVVYWYAYDQHYHPVLVD